MLRMAPSSTAMPTSADTTDLLTDQAMWVPLAEWPRKYSSNTTRSPWSTRKPVVLRAARKGPVSMVRSPKRKVAGRV